MKSLSESNTNMIESARATRSQSKISANFPLHGHNYEWVLYIPKALSLLLLQVWLRFYDQQVLGLFVTFPGRSTSIRGVSAQAERGCFQIQIRLLT